MRVQPEGEALGWPRLKQALNEAYPESEVLGIEAPLNRRSAAVAPVRQPDERVIYAFVDPYRGEVTGSYSGFNVQRFFRDFHRSLFLPFPWGELLVTAFFAALLVSLWSALRFLKRWWKGFFRFRRGRGRARWSEWHKLSGLWSGWFLLVIGVTAGWYLFEAARYSFGDSLFSYAGQGESARHRIPAPERPGDDPGEARQLPLADLLRTVQRERPDLELRSLRFDEEAGTLYVDGQSDHLLVRNRANQVIVDARSGELLYNLSASDLPPYWRWADTADPLHFGTFGGLASKVVWFGFGLLLSGLVLTGLRMHVLRMARNGGSAGAGRGVAVAPAILVSLLVLAASVPGALKRARDFGPVEETGRALPQLDTGVAVAISLWVAVTLAILALWTAMLWRSRLENSPARDGSPGSAPDPPPPPGGRARFP